MDSPARRTGGGGRATWKWVVAGVLVLCLVVTAVLVGGRLVGNGTPVLEGEETSAGRMLGWGDATRVDRFDVSPTANPEWSVYDGPGHADQGRRSPSAVTVQDGVLTIRGDEQGTTGGMAWLPGQMYGRWEGRLRAPASDPTYHALMLLWPDAEDWPVGGEVDFVELTDADRQRAEYFLHYDVDNKQEHGEIPIDATQWHNWAVEWTPDHIIAYVDGREWFRSVDRKTLPPRPMHLTIH